MKTLTLEDDMPANARRLWQLAEKHDWVVWATSAIGTPCGTDGHPLHRTKRVPLFDTNTGAPLMTDGDKPKQRIEVVKLDEFQIVKSVVLRLRRGTLRLAATWEDGTFRSCLRQSPFGRLTSREVVALIELRREVAS